LKLRAVLGAALVTVPLGLGASLGGAATKSGTPAQVAAAVSASTSIASIPSNLTPPLSDFADAPNSQNYAGIATLKKCDPFHHANLIASPAPCNFGDLSSSKTVVFVGDSNVGNWAPSFEMGFPMTKYRLAVFPYSGCHTPDMTYTGTGAQSCNEWHKAVIKAIQRLHPYAVIVVSAPFGSTHGATETQWVAAMKKPFVEATLDSPSTLRILMGTSPIFPSPIPPCLVSNSDPQSCAVADTPTSVYGRYLARDQQIATAASATLISVDPWLCTMGSCSPIISKFLVYVDEDHVSTDYSQFVSQVAMSAVTKALKG
jgi:hypothetical protein